MDGAHLLNAEFSGIDEVQDRREAGEARSLHPRGLGEIQSPSIANAVNEQKQEDRRDRDLNRLEKIDLELCERVTSQEATTPSISVGMVHTTLELYAPDRAQRRDRRRRCRGRASGT